jgi:pimeloyl-ACP methyl ester carboxylesterase
MSQQPHVEVHDRGRGPYLLLVHGFLSSRGQWRANLEGLTAFCRPVVLELLGHGRSPAPDDPSAYRAEAYHESFERLRQKLGAERWIVCGQSFGAGLTMGYALRHPERLYGQIFTNSNSALARVDLGEQEARAQAVEAGGLAALEAMRIHPKHARRLPPAIHRELLEDAQRLSPKGIAHSIRVTRVNTSMVDRFADIAVPSLFVNGRFEKKFQPLRDQAAASIPGIRVVDLDGGHGVNIDQADAFNRAVEEFVAEVCAPEAPVQGR